MTEHHAAASLPQVGQHGRDRVLRGALVSFPFDLQARLVDARELQDVYEIGVAMLARIPGTIGLKVLQRNDSGDLVVVHAWRSPVSATSLLADDDLGRTVLKHWIATHGIGRSPQEFARPFTDPACPGWLLIPMLAGNELIGAIAAERRDGEVFSYSVEDVIAFSAAAAGMAWGIQTVFLRDRTDMLAMQESRDDIASQERREIGRELHDGVVQDLAYINLKLELAERYADAQPQQARAELTASRSLLERAVTELRRTIGDLRRPPASRHGITGQLRALVTTMPQGATDVEMDFRQVSGVQLVPEVERAVVGIVREAVQNVRKHANAQSIRLEVRRADDELRVLVTDDGMGMQRSHTPGHFGMEQMRELAEDLGGTLDVESGPGRGTSIEARLPLVLPAEPRSGGYSGLAASESVSDGAATFISAGPEWGA